MSSTTKIAAHHQGDLPRVATLAAGSAMAEPVVRSRDHATTTLDSSPDLTDTGATRPARAGLNQPSVAPQPEPLPEHAEQRQISGCQMPNHLPPMVVPPSMLARIHGHTTSISEPVMRDLPSQFGKHPEHSETQSSDTGHPSTEHHPLSRIIGGPNCDCLRDYEPHPSGPSESASSKSMPTAPNRPEPPA